MTDLIASYVNEKLDDYLKFLKKLLNKYGFLDIIGVIMIMQGKNSAFNKY